ncbi:MAG: hypothetical protein Q7W30_09640 [Coriobacteriia bacterium]|nr:hypothetical protein [Coriobacteriia bacterium]
MSDELSTDDFDDDDVPMSLGRRILTGVVMTVVGLAAVYAMVRVASPQIREEQKAPNPHYFEECGVCHGMNPAAKLIEVKK